MSTLAQIQAGGSGLWYRLHVFCFDLRQFKDREDSRGRLECVTDTSYLGLPYFTEEEVKLLKGLRTSATSDKTLATLLEETLQEKLFRKKRVQVSDFRVCAAHDLAPLFERAFGIKPKQMNSSSFRKLVDSSGLELPDGTSFKGFGKRGEAPQPITKGEAQPSQSKRKAKGKKGPSETPYRRGLPSTLTPRSRQGGNKSIRVEPASLESGDQFSVIPGNDNTLRLRPRHNNLTGEKYLSLSAKPSPSDLSNGTVELKFTELQDDVRIGCLRAADKLEITITFNEIQHQSVPASAFDSQSDFLVFENIISRSEAYRQSISASRIVIITDNHPKLEQFIGEIHTSSEINPYLNREMSWWPAKSDFRTFLRAVAKEEYECTKRDLTKTSLRNLKADFQKIEGLTTKAKVRAVGARHTGSKSAEMKNFLDDRQIYRVTLSPGREFQPNVDEKGKVIHLAVSRGQKYKLAWFHPRTNHYQQIKGVVSQLDEDLVACSNTILLAMVISIPDKMFPDEVCSFSVIPVADKTTYLRTKTALKRIDLMPMSAPASQVHDCLLLGRAPLKMSESPVSPDHSQQLVAAGLDSSQANAANVALNFNATAIQGPPGTGKTSTVVAMIAELVKAESEAGHEIPKILICAPSNAGTNNLVRMWDRKVQTDSTGLLGALKAVRVLPDSFYRPRDAAGSPAAAGFTTNALFELVESTKTDFPPEYGIMRHREALGEWEDFEDLLMRIIKGETNKDIRREFAELKDQMDKDILSDTNIVFTTCVGAGTHQVQYFFGQEFVVIDEAGQATEAETAIPLCTRSVKQVVLIGDPMQLPPVSPRNIPLLRYSMLERLSRCSSESVALLSPVANAESLGPRAVNIPSANKPVFREGYVPPHLRHKVKDHGDPKKSSTETAGSQDPRRNPPAAGNVSIIGPKWSLLRSNYRSTVSIVNVISQHFYNNNLLATTPDPKEVDFVTHMWHGASPETDGQFFMPQPSIVWQDIEAETEQKDEASYSTVNPTSINTIIELLKMVERLDGNIEPHEIAVICMYSSQVAALRAATQQHLGRLRNIEINTVDSFQGSERRYIIMDMVRANVQRNLGFIDDVRRFNVAVSRAMKKVIIVGSYVMYGVGFRFHHGREHRALHAVATTARAGQASSFRPPFACTEYVKN
ncbi:ATP-dependent helicase NAM7 [Drechslerella dactyloides]|uniref:ATP-dependent helicase NAM7 n=1 Tax=Drechslerella dactyloides TaxID=74499 RepID=A0AAD6NGV9_DREDA|nr:ATP-dependent helicase NAM7 [Drechslerella dactyloides]